MEIRHIRVTGTVQGVFYRASAQSRADELGLTGWVRNTADGAVELVAAGEAPAVEDFVAWCRRGPDHAVVDELAERPATEEERSALPASDFEIRR